MEYGLDVANLGVCADPRRVLELAVAAEGAGWDALFLWDHWGFVWSMDAGDPWVMLAAAAQATTRLRLGTAITPLARRRPQMLANTLASLDVLSNGRVIFGAGLGGMPEEFSDFGEDVNAKVRAAKLDEGLDILDRWLKGERVQHQSQYYTVKDVQLLPRGVQSPRMPIWIGAESGNALRRAARWDGWVIYTVDTEGRLVRSPQDVADSLDKILHYRAEAGLGAAGYDVVVTGMSQPGEYVAAYQAVGATWWLETLHGMRFDFDTLMARVKAGPPRT